MQDFPAAQQADALRSSPPLTIRMFGAQVVQMRCSCLHVGGQHVRDNAGTQACHAAAAPRRVYGLCQRQCSFLRVVALLIRCSAKAQASPG